MNEERKNITRNVLKHLLKAMQQRMKHNMDVQEARANGDKDLESLREEEVELVDTDVPCPPEDATVPEDDIENDRLAQEIEEMLTVEDEEEEEEEPVIPSIFDVKGEEAKPKAVEITSISVSKPKKGRGRK